jgi:Zinc finger, C3HC4 type (RING finger)
MVVTQAKLEEENKLKDQAVKLVEAESKTLLSTKKNTQTRLTILTRKHDLDRRRHSEQVKALEHEISCLQRAMAHSKLAELCRPCIICKAAEASVVFLPCAHQVLCAECGKDKEDMNNEKCPCCRARIEERVFVYGLGA